MMVFQILSLAYFKFEQLFYYNIVSIPWLDVHKSSDFLLWMFPKADLNFASWLWLRMYKVCFLCKCVHKNTQNTEAFLQFL